MTCNFLRSESSGSLTRILFFSGAIILAAEPAQWLYRSWSDPVWDSNGWMMSLVVLMLFAWSISSPRVTAGSQQRIALLLIAASAIVRLSSQLLGINFIGAITLTCDVYALALLLGTHCRSRALAPGWLALLFFMSLPLERVIQRVLGFALQQWSASGACGLLGLLGFDPTCDGISMRIAGENVLVDLPCSGARGLLMIASLYVVIACLNRPRPISAIAGIAVMLASAWASNVARISLLAIGVVQQRSSSGFNVMEAPWHELIGYSTLSMGLLPVLLWGSYVRSTPTGMRGDRWVEGCLSRAAMKLLRPTRDLLSFDIFNRRPWLPALGFCLLSLAIVRLPTHAVDVSAAVKAVPLPTLIGDRIKTPLPLSGQEIAYFTQYGGQAQRAAYGQHTLLTIDTTSPLRHLHSPDECLRAIGHEVRYLGVIDDSLPSALYRSRDQNNKLWRISVTFVSEQGHLTTNVAHAVWLWLQNPSMAWTMIQRIRRWDGDPAQDEEFDQNIIQMLDLPHPSHSDPHYTINASGETFL